MGKIVRAIALHFFRVLSGRRLRRQMKAHQIQLHRRGTDGGSDEGTVIEFPGGLPAFGLFGGCGAHPQFRHLEQPPQGYKFLHSSDGSPRLGLFKTLLAIKKFAVACLKRGASLKEILVFTMSRSLKSQLRMGIREADLIFFPSVPFHFNQFPWMIEIEDTTSLFLPFIRNGQILDLNGEREKNFFPVIRELLESPNCRAIVTHIKSTAESLPVLFKNPKLKDKIFHIPIGINLPVWSEKLKLKASARPAAPVLLFSNSWHQMPGGFFVRGGLDVIEAFALIVKEIPQAKLVIRSQLPKRLPARARELIKTLDIEVLEEFLPGDQWEELKRCSDYFMFPSARIHVVSILEAMAYGMAIVTSNGWGIEDYAVHDRNAVIVPGREKVSWIDAESGALREDYSSLYQSNPDVFIPLAAAFLKLHADPARKARLTLQARNDVESKFNLANWNRELSEVFEFSLKKREARVTPSLTNHRVLDLL